MISPTANGVVRLLIGTDNNALPNAAQTMQKVSKWKLYKTAALNLSERVTGSGRFFMPSAPAGAQNCAREYKILPTQKMRYSALQGHCF